MRIAIPIADGLLSAHFGHSERFALLDVDLKAQQILQTEEVEAPEHKPGLLPRWLKERGVNLVIAGGMGSSAQTLLQAASIGVLCGAPAEAPGELVRKYLAGELRTQPVACNHSHHHHPSH